MLYNDYEFEWDVDKAETNLRKHGVHFADASTLWREEAHALEIHDYLHSAGEDRWVRLGISSLGKIIVAVFCEVSDHKIIRIISARHANKKEKEKFYERLNEKTLRLL